MRIRKLLPLLLLLAFIPSAFAQDIFDENVIREEAPEIPQVRMQVHFIELTDKAIADLGLTKAFREHVLPKGTIKDWQKLEAASKSFRSIDVVMQSGQEAYASAVLEAAMPESFEESEITISKDLRIELPSTPVMGEPRQDVGITVTVTPQVDEKGRIHVELHPKHVRLVGWTVGDKVMTGNRAIAEHSTPIFDTKEVRFEARLSSGDTLVKAMSYRGGKVKTGHYCLLTASLVELPKAKPVAMPEEVIPQVGVTLEKVRVSAKDVKAFEQAVGDATKLQDLYDKGVGDVLVRTTTLGTSGTEIYTGTIKEQQFAESHEESEIYLPDDGEAPKVPGRSVKITPITPVYGEPQWDLGSTLTLTPQVSADGGAIQLDVHPRQVTHVGDVKYACNTRIAPKADTVEAIKADVKKPIFEADEVRTQFHVRPGIPMVISRRAHKSSPRIRAGKHISIFRNSFETLENSGEAVYVYTIIRVDRLGTTGAKKK